MLLQWLTRLALTPMDSINHSLIISREVLIDFNTANTTCPAGMYFLIHPSVWTNDERMAVHCLESGCIGLHIPSDLEISLGPRDVPRASPLGHLSGLGKSLGRRGCTTQYIPPLGSVRVQCIPTRGSVRPFSQV